MQPIKSRLPIIISDIAYNVVVLQENGAEFRATEATGDIRCEVCEVSVNSSHQLQAHMTGG